MSMREPNSLRQFYDREINFKTEALWHGGFDVALRDSLHGHKAQRNTKTIAEAVQSLVDAVAIHFRSVPEEADLTLSAE